jgi:hypothetical protein
VLAIVIGSAVPASAQEMWIAPTVQKDFGGDDVRGAVWPVTPYGVVRLAFAVPNNMRSFQRATLALISDPPAGAATLTIYVCNAQNGQFIRLDCDGPSEYPFVGSPYQLGEIDISSAIGAKLKVPGQDYIAVLAFTSPTIQTDHIVGMRFAYEMSSTLSEQQCAARQMMVGIDADGNALCAPLPPVAPSNLTLVSRVAANTPVVIAWNHDGVDTSGYRLYVDGVETDLGPLAPGSSGRYEISHSGFALGEHVVIVAAYNSSGVTMSMQLLVTAVP